MFNENFRVIIKFFAATRAKIQVKTFIKEDRPIPVGKRTADLLMFPKDAFVVGPRQAGKVRFDLGSLSPATSTERRGFNRVDFAAHFTHFRVFPSQRYSSHRDD